MRPLDRRHSMIIGLFSGVLLVACAPSAPPPEPSAAPAPAEFSAEDQEAVREVFNSMSAGDIAGDLDAIERYLTEDYVQIDPRVAGLITGRQAWRAWADALEYGGAEQGGFTIDDIQGSGDLAYVIWTWEGTWIEAGEPVGGDSKGASVFERQEDGSWRQALVAWNSDPEESP